MDRYDWGRLSALQVGRYAEYFVKMEFTLYGFEVYTSEVDDHGVDFVMRKGEGRYFEVQVKSVRVGRSNYIFLPKSKFPMRDTMLAAVVLLYPGQEPQLYLIPATAWREPNALLVDRVYEGLTSAPEWGLNLSEKNAPLLVPYAFSEMVERL
jgi:hypothetical protein